MSLVRTWTRKWGGLAAIGAGAAALSVGAIAATEQMARAGGNPIVLVRFLLGYTARDGRFIATAGRGATNVDRNAVLMLVFSGNVDSGRAIRATLPLTLKEQKELEDKIQADPNYDPTKDGYEPGVVPRRRSDDRAAFYVATGSVNTFSVAITAQGPAGVSTAPGQFFKYVPPRKTRAAGNRIVFNPRYTVSSYNKPGEIDYHPEALDADTTYSVVLDGGPSPSNPATTLRNVEGEPLAARFSSTFTTRNRYVQDFNRPHFRTTTPTDQTTEVPYDADIDIEFDEPMDIASFVTPRFQGDDAWTIAVRYTQNFALNGTFTGKNILGVVRVKPQTAGNVVQFRPTQGFGKGPFEVQCVVTNGVTDLSGNNIIRQFQFTFRTESNPNAEDIGQVDETFDTANKRDAAFVPSGDFIGAQWNGTVKGALTTSVQTATFNVAGPGAPTVSGTGINLWYHQPIAVQMLFPVTLMGTRSRTITGFGWFTGVVRGRTYPNTTIQLGHASDPVTANGFPPGQAPDLQNYGDTPILVVPSTTYRTPTTATNNVVPGPTFVKNFNYDGQRPVILWMTHNGDPASAPIGPPPVPPIDNWERWRYDANFPLTTSAAAVGTAAQTNGWLYSTRFNYLTPGAEAQSLFYDMGRENARLLPQQIVPITQPSGTTIVFQWQGAKADVTVPTTPDLNTLTGWLNDIRSLSNYRHVRFRVTLQNNLQTGTVSFIDTLTFPYVFQQ
jgi:hypothetical protein